MDEIKRVTIKSQNDDTVVLGGYAVIWGNETDRDLENEYFTKETDFWLDKWTGPRPVLYEHGGHPVVKSSVLGYAVKFEAGDVGLEITAELDRHNRYVDDVIELAKAGVLGWSSGAVGHLSQRGEHGEIKSWAIAEMTLTVSPAEPRLLELPIIKTMLADANLTIPEGILEDIEAAEIVDLTLEAESTDADEELDSVDNKYSVRPETIVAAVAACVALERHGGNND